MDMRAVLRRVVSASGFTGMQHNVALTAVQWATHQTL